MIRRPLYIASAISLLLALSLAMLWVRGHWKTDSVFALQKRYFFSFDSQGGTITLVCARAEHGERFRKENGWTGGLVHALPFMDYRPDPPLSMAERLGFAARSISAVLEKGDTQPLFILRTVAVPDWLVCILLLSMPAIMATRTFRRRPRRGFCPHCSYDLTGNVSGVCPECGLPTTAVR